MSRYTQRAVACRGLAGIPGLETMANDPRWGKSFCDPPIQITSSTAKNAGGRMNAFQHVGRLNTGKPFKVGKRLKCEYVKTTLQTQRQQVKVYHKGRIVKQCHYPLPQK